MSHIAPHPLQVFLNGSNSVVDNTNTGLYCIVPRFSSFSLFLALIALVAHNVDEMQSGRADYCYLVLGELSRFVYCLLQKIKLSSALPVIEKWEAYMPPKHSCFAIID